MFGLFLVDQCPFGAPFLDPETEELVTCDQRNFEEQCPHGFECVADGVCCREEPTCKCIVNIKQMLSR